MKIGWLVWMFEDSVPEFYEDGKEPGHGYAKVRIVYAIIED